jgi:hypothetical protein
MESPKSGSRRNSRQRIIDLEAKEIERSGMAAAEAAADAAAKGETPAETAGPSDDGQSEVDQAARESIEAASRRSAIPSGEAAAASSGSPANEAEAPGRRPSGTAGLLASGLAGGAAAIGLAALLNAAGLVSIVPGGGAERYAEESRQLLGEVESLKTGLAGLEARFSGQAGTVSPQDLAAAIDRIAIAEKSLAELQAEIPDLRSMRSELSGLSEKFGGLEKSFAAISQGAGHSAPAATADITGLAEKLAGETSGLVASLQALYGRVAALETAVAQITETGRQASQAGDEAARLLAATTIEGAIADGKPFAEMIAPVEALVGPGPAIERLRQFAAAGVPTNAQLLAEFDAVRGAVLDVSDEAPKGLFEKLVDNAKDLVKVEPAGPVPGDTPAAILSRVKAGLSAGDLAAAMTAWQSLTEARHNAGNAFGEKLSRRVEADKALADVLAALRASGRG